MRSKWLAIGLSLLLVALLVGACGPAPTPELRPPPPSEPKGPGKDLASISVEKMVSIDGGANWVNAVDQDVCQNVEFQIIVTHDAVVPLYDIVITDHLPDCLEYIDGSATPTPDSTAPYIWSFPGPVQPGDPIEITFSAHVVESGECKNQVSVDGVYNGDILHDLDVAYVTGITGELVEHKMHYPQLPEGDGGFSVMATLNDAAEPCYVADDWLCSHPGLVTDIHFWGHWNGSSTIIKFEIKIAEKTGTCGVGQILWEQVFPISDVSVSNLIPALPSGWYNPFAGQYYENVSDGYYRYDIENIDAPFCQEVGEEYWLIVGAYVVDPNTAGVWGWRNTESAHFGCNAIYSHYLDQGWQPLYDPFDVSQPVPQPIDMAFIITGGEPCETCQCGAAWNEVVVSWTDTFGTNHNWTTGSCGNTLDQISDLSGLITVNSSIGCIPDGCSLDYTWDVSTLIGSLPFPPSGSVLPAEFTPQGSSLNSYVVTLNASCDGDECPSCTIYIKKVFPPEAKPSIHMEKVVSNDGGVNWADEVEQFVCNDVQFHITITNNGGVSLININVWDSLSGYLSYVQGSANYIPDSTAPYIIWNFPGPLPPGGTIDITFSAHVDDAGRHTNCVKVYAETVDGEEVYYEDCAYVTTGTLL